MPLWAVLKPVKERERIERRRKRRMKEKKGRKPFIWIGGSVLYI